jgi:molybdopterin/thiamine biosynthesis adenylyltransferase
MTAGPAPTADQRFARLEAIEWWDQARVRAARVLVVGAGALGNEVVKNLSLLGAGHLVIADRDRVERSNLSRSVLFREADEGRPKAECAARAARGIFPSIEARPLVADIVAEVGLGLFRWADVVVGAVDNREARVFVNSACARVGRPWVDGGIEVLQGVARGFFPPETACYECTMSKVDWDLIEQRRSCALLARRAVAGRGEPTTPTTASVIGAIEAQEVMKLLHGLPALLGRGFVFDGASHGSYPVAYAVKPDCPWHEAPAPIEAAAELGRDSTLREVWDEASRRLGGLDALEWSREIVEAFECRACADTETVLQPLERLAEERARCPRCGEPRAPRLLHGVGRESALLSRTVGGVGLPAWDVMWGRHGARQLGLELARDRAAVLAEERP